MITCRSGLLLTAVLTAGIVQAADRTEVTFPDGRIFPESLTSTRDGTLYIGSLVLDNVYRVAPAATRAEVWIQPHANGVQDVRGVLADEPAGLLWVCSSPPAGRGGAPPPAGEPAVMAFRLKDASLAGRYPFPGGGLCSDMVVARDGTLYATDTRQARILRLKKGAPTLDVWAADPLLTSIDGITILADGSVYANSISQGSLVRVPVTRDGSAGQAVKLETSRPIKQPDGMRWIGGSTLLLVEMAGRLDEVTINGDKAEVKTLKDGLTEPSAVTLVDGIAYVTECRPSLRNRTEDPGPFRVIGVPYRAPK